VDAAHQRLFVQNNVDNKERKTQTSAGNFSKLTVFKLYFRRSAPAGRQEKALDRASFE
jgi:hypothetical protein